MQASRKKKSSSSSRHKKSSSSSQRHSTYQERPDYDDEVEDSGRDTLTPLIKERQEREFDRVNRQPRGGGNSRHHSHNNRSNDHSHDPREDDGSSYNGNSQQRKYKSHSHQHQKQHKASLGRFINDRNNNPDANDDEFQQLIQTSDSESIACSTLTPPTVFRDMDDDETDEGSRNNVRNGGYADYRQNGDIATTTNGAPSSLKRFGYGGFRRNAARTSNTTTNGSVSVNNESWNAINKGLGIGIKGKDVGGTGVMYRSADSTHRALEELKRKRNEAREKQRAVKILCALVLLAMSVHYVGKVGSGGGGDGYEKSGLKGASKDKVYGDVKDLGYGGERASVDGVGSGGAPAAAAGGGATGGEEGKPHSFNGAVGAYSQEYYNDEYALPPPTEKIYDEEHKFLLPLRHYSDYKDPRRPTDTAFFFHVPRAGGSTVKDIFGKCMKLVQSSEVGVRDGHGNDPMLQVIDVNDSKYVNVDTTTIPGIQRAVDLGLANSGYADLVVSSYFHVAASLFDLEHQGRAFIMLRDPIERATSMYYHRVKEVGDLESTISIEDYAQGNGIENNWMTRFLTNRMEGELTKDDLDIAKDILKEKFMIGFLEDIEESVYRFMKYNGWKYSEDENVKMGQEDCIRDLAMVGSNINPNEYEIPKRGTQAYALITWQTQFDTKLFEYAKELFDYQTKTYGSKERKKILKKQKKKGGK